MNILFLTRKRHTDIGGLARFTHLLVSQFDSSPVVCIKEPRTWTRFVQDRIQVVYATDATLLPFGALCKWLSGVPLVVIVYGKDLTFPHWWYQLAIRLFLPYADRIVAISPQTASLTGAYGINSKKLHVIIPGISIQQFQHKQPVRRRWSKNARVLLTLGNLIERKGHTWFITRVLPRLPNRWVYVIVGEGPERAHIQSGAQAAGVADRVFLFPRQPDAKVAAILSQTDIYVSPNQNVPGDFEGFGIAAGEAAAMGLPVVANRINGIPAMIHDGKNGILIPPDVKAWTSTINRLGTKEAKARFGRLARQYTRKHFSWKNTIRAHKKLFSSLIPSSKT